MNFIDHANLDRKFGGAERRDLLFYRVCRDHSECWNMQPVYPDVSPAQLAFTSQSHRNPALVISTGA
jgi:hypothetical protein